MPTQNLSIPLNDHLKSGLFTETSPKALFLPKSQHSLSLL